MKRCLVFLVLGMGLGIWGDRTIRASLNSLPLPDFAKAPIVDLYGR